MTPEQQRIAIAVACGKWHSGWPHEYMNQADRLRHIPDYLNDLNDMHEAEKVLTDEQDLEYSEALEQVVEGRFVTNNAEDMRRLRSATASQRAEAFLRTIGKWEEAK